MRSFSEREEGSGCGHPDIEDHSADGQIAAIGPVEQAMAEVLQVELAPFQQRVEQAKRWAPSSDQVPGGTVAWARRNSSGGSSSISSIGGSSSGE